MRLFENRATLGFAAALVTGVLTGSAFATNGACNQNTSSPQCANENIGSDVNGPLCGGGMVCELTGGPQQQCGCAAPVAECPPDDINECCDPATGGGGVFTDSLGQTITVNSVRGGRISGAGATLFFPFFQSPSGTVDVIDVDADGIAGFCDPTLNPTGCPPGSFEFVDQLGRLYTPGQSLNTFWEFQYRSVGSVNGFNEFVGNQLCGTLVRSVPAEGGIYNTFPYATAGIPSAQTGAGQYGTGSPLEPCEIDFSFLDVPSAWGVQVAPGGKVCFIKCFTNADCPGGQTCAGGSCTPPAACTNDEDCDFDGIVGKCRGNAKWDSQPTQAGYGLNPILSSTGYLSNLQLLSRECGVCSLGGNICDLDSNCNGAQQCVNGFCAISHLPCVTTCPAISGEVCTDKAGPAVALNNNVSTPDNDTIFDFIGAVVPVGVVANRGAAVENAKYSELQYLFVTGRWPNGENLVGSTRSVGSGTRNAIMNSLGIDTSWGRGDNVGNEFPTSATTDIGPGHQSVNAQGSSQIEQAVRNRRLAVGYTGLGGQGRAIADALAFEYEIVNVCKDVDTNGNPLCNCNNVPHNCPALRRCNATPSIVCEVDADCPIGETCTGKLLDADSSNNGYVRPNTNTILDNCDACCGYQIVGNGSFVTRGDPFATSGPSEMNDRAVRDYIQNLSNSVSNFSGVNPNVCTFAEVCDLLTTQNCETDADCGANGPCDTPRPCTTNGQCVTNYCDNDSSIGCDVNADCGAGNCVPAPAICLNQLNTPGQFLATTFTLPDGTDCTQSLDDGMIFTANLNLNQALQNFQRNPTTGPPAFPTPAFASVNPNSGGRAPGRKTGFTYSDGKSAGAVQYLCWDGSGTTAADYVNLSGNQLPKRNRVQGDMDEDCSRDLGDAAQLVSALYAPRAWQRSAAANNDGSGCYGAVTNAGCPAGVDQAIPEIMADFDGDGNVTKEDARYWMDGLAMGIVGRCSIDKTDCAIAADCDSVQTCVNNACSITLLECTINSDCPPVVQTCADAKKLDRKQGAIAIDLAIQGAARPFPWADDGERLLCSIANVICTIDSNCPGGETCTRLLPAGDVRRNLVVPPAAPGDEPTFLVPKRDVNDALMPFLSTGAAYKPGDFRGDVAGGRPQDCRAGRCSINGFTCVTNADCPPMNPNAGGDPIGWDAKVNALDVQYSCAQAQGNWGNLNDAVFIDLSCDMNGDCAVDANDLRELVLTILEAELGDANLDGVVDAADAAIVNNSLANPPAHPCWTDGDFDFDGDVDSDDSICAGGIFGDVLTAGGGSSSPPDGVVDVDDLLCALDAFVGIDVVCVGKTDLVPCDCPCVVDADCSVQSCGPTCVFGVCSCESAVGPSAECDAHTGGVNVPCVNDRCRLIDVDDLLAELDAFAGIYACSCP